MSVDTLLKQAEELSLEERAELLQRLESGMLDAGWEPELPITDEVKAMLDARIADADANPDAGIPWEVVKAEALKRIRK
ncbi:MAG TPA: addiction module protein [Urbifossiella sp.]|nr:addiction module protein [Urbifossiella sp.]